VQLPIIWLQLRNKVYSVCNNQPTIEHYRKTVTVIYKVGILVKSLLRSCDKPYTSMALSIIFYSVNLVLMSLESIVRENAYNCQTGFFTFLA
jgi:hypothetical protein